MQSPTVAKQPTLKLIRITSANKPGKSFIAPTRQPSILSESPRGKVGRRPTGMMSVAGLSPAAARRSAIFNQAVIMEELARQRREKARQAKIAKKVLAKEYKKKVFRKIAGSGASR